MVLYSFVFTPPIPQERPNLGLTPLAMTARSSVSFVCRAIGRAEHGATCCSPYGAGADFRVRSKELDRVIEMIWNISLILTQAARITVFKL
jgi:hypothetical protein